MTPILSAIMDVLGIHPLSDPGQNAPTEVRVRLILATAAHDVLRLVEPDVADIAPLAASVASAMESTAKSVMDAPRRQPAPAPAPASEPTPPEPPAPAPEPAPAPVPAPAPAEPVPAPAAPAAPTTPEAPAGGTQ